MKTQSSVKKIFSLISILVFVIAIVSISSCQKKKEDRLANTWKLVKISKDTLVDYYETWSFDGSDLLILRRNDVLSTFDTMSTGTYSVDAKLSKTFMEMDGMESTFYNGKWQILTLNEDILIMLNESNGNWIYREFVKN